MFSHIPVLAHHVLELLSLENPKTYLDLTAGGGGHAELFLNKYKNLNAILIDRDPDAVAHLTEKFSGNKRVKCVHAKASELDKIMFLLKSARPDIILADLGVSSYQFDTKSRGFSFDKEALLDMRMDFSSGMTALELIASKRESELQEILSRFGEERESKTVARALKKGVEEGLTTTTEFQKLIALVKHHEKRGINPATKSFMALRIAVNNEMDELALMLEKGYRLLNLGGKMGIISFHSIEDRIAKHFFQARKDDPVFYTPGGYNDAEGVKVYKFAEASDEEISENPRSRSAKLRVIEKL